MLGQRPTTVQVRGADIAVYAEDTGTPYVAVDFPGGRQTRHYCTRIPTSFGT